jgi:peroxiredoxin
VQLQDQAQSFEAAGIAIVAITYDAPDLQRKFIERFSITYPLLSDVAAGSMTSLGILNTEYEPGDSAYGVPHPGIFVLDRDLNVVGKLFVDGYERRVDAAAVLAFARGLLDARGSP